MCLQVKLYFKTTNMEVKAARVSGCSVNRRKSLSSHLETLDPELTLSSVLLKLQNKPGHVAAAPVSVSECLSYTRLEILQSFPKRLNIRINL